MQTGQSRYGDGDLLGVPSNHADGTLLSVEFTIHPLADESGALTGIAATLRDATARFAELRALRKQAAAAGSAAAG